MDAGALGRGAEVSHPQAFHTSCRSGVEGISGFQINAASPRLTREQLSALARAHARYEAPHDLPYEPTADEMQAFPVALKLMMDPVLGPVASRTQYVGREYRGHGGGPDEGRFGNYFCHMVVGGSAEDPFDGLSGIELWGAPHWTTTESQDVALPDLGPLAPGPVDVTHVLEAVADAPAGVATGVLDGALKALDGGPSVLVVEPVAARAVTWLAWITFALPPDMSRQLTFSTFEGRPEQILDLHVVATLPSCESGGSTSSHFTRIDVTTEASTVEASLYARAATALAGDGPDALVGAVLRARGATLAARGASLAIVGRVTSLVTDGDLSTVLEQLIAMVRSGRVADAADAATAVPVSAAGDRAAIDMWAQLHLQARLSTAGDAARELASAALSRIVAHLDALPADLEPVPSSAPAAPGVAAIGAWLRATEAVQGTDASGALLDHGVRLGLLGLNVPVDTRIAKVIVHDLERPAMAAALDAIDRDGSNDHVIRLVTEAVADEPQTSRAARRRLMALSRYAMARQTIRQRADVLGTFDAHAAWQRVRVASDPSLRPEAARALAAIAADDNAYADIRELWGERGPQTEADTNDLLRAYLDAGVSAPTADLDQAVALLMRAPLPKHRPSTTSLGFTVATFPQAAPRSELCAWEAGFERPPFTPRTLAQWADRAVIALDAPADKVPDERWEELLDGVGDTLVNQRRDPDFNAVLGRFRRTDFDRVCEALGTRLGALVRDAEDRPQFAAQEFELWMRLSDRELVDTVLPSAFSRLSGRDVEDVATLVSEASEPDWLAWAERHPRARARAAVARVFGRKHKDPNP